MALHASTARRLAPGRLAPRSAKTLGVPREYSKHLGVPSLPLGYPGGGTRHYRGCPLKSTNREALTEYMIALADVQAA